MGRKLWKCDFEKCGDIALWIRKWKGQLFRLCTKHEAYFQRNHWGRHVDELELTEDDFCYFERKDKEFEKKGLVNLTIYKLKDGSDKIRVTNRETGESRTSVFKSVDGLNRFLESYDSLKKKGLSFENLVKSLEDSST